MNIHKRGLLRNLTNAELLALLKKNNDKDILREYIERCTDGRINKELNISKKDSKIISSFVAY